MVGCFNIPQKQRQGGEGGIEIDREGGERGREKGRGAGSGQGGREGQRVKAAKEREER